MYILCFHQINLLHYLFFLYCLLPHYSTACHALHYIIFIHKCVVFQYYSLAFCFCFSPSHTSLSET
jgi:hypothetical protein